jgi:hypothetical protein
MTPAQKAAIQQHADAIAAILYADTDPATLDTLESIECSVRDKILEHVSPQIGIFLSNNLPTQSPEDGEPSKAVSEN